MQKVISKDGTTIAFDRLGEGPVIILIDGALCYRGFGPSGPLAARLARDFTVYTYDNAVMGDGALPAEAAKAATMPALVLDGSESPAFMHEAAETLAKAMPHAERKTLEGQTHMVSPEALAPVLEEFFKG